MSQGKKREREEAVLLPEGWLDFGVAELAAAAAAVERETATVRGAMGHAGKPDEEYAEARAAVAGEFIYLPGKDGAGQVRRAFTGLCAASEALVRARGGALGAVSHSHIVKAECALSAKASFSLFCFPTSVLSAWRCLSLRVLPLGSERGCSAQSNVVLAKALWCAGAVPARGLGVYPLFCERMAMQCAELVLAKAL